jgi:hypothetical protein
MPSKLTEQKAVTIYTQILRNIVEKEMGDQTTYQDELDKCARKFLGVHFKGVYASDLIPVLNGVKRYAIVNLDRSTQAGSHWIALAYHSNKIYVYDSFGRQSTKIIPSLWTSGNVSTIVDAQHDAEQDMSEQDCGQRSLAWLMFFDNWGASNAILI